MIILDILAYLSDYIRLRNVQDASGERLYHISGKVLNARDYGLPQCRQRFFIVGHQKVSGKHFVWPECRPRVALTSILDEDAHAALMEPSFVLSCFSMETFVW